jgi:hypothetical protein
MLKRPRESNKTPPEPTTFHQLAQAGLELEGNTGRFVAQQTVIGTTLVTDYPASGVPNVDVGLEAPTGDDQRPEPVGTPAEIDASLERIERERGDAE